MSEDESELLRRKLVREKKARKEAEALLEVKSRELYARNVALEKEIEVREKIERDLAEKAAELVRSNEELQQFAYVASHDLQAPLRNIMGFSRLLTSHSKDDLDEKGEEFLGFIQEGAKAMYALINDLLDLSRVGTQGGQLQPVDLGELMALVERGFDEDINSGRVSIQYSGLPQVSADQTQLRQLLSNLISNGIKFQPPGQVAKISVTAVKLNEGWQICVADNGIGIEQKHQDRIFVIFRRLHTPDEYPGTGIGLAICKKIVERHGGRLRVESAPGEGTRFFFTLSGINSDTDAQEAPV